LPQGSLGIRVVWIDAQGLAVMRGGFIAFAHLGKSQSQVEFGAAIFRVQAKGRFIDWNGFG